MVGRVVNHLDRKVLSRSVYKISVVIATTCTLLCPLFGVMYRTITLHVVLCQYIQF